VTRFVVTVCPQLKQSSDSKLHSVYVFCSKQYQDLAYVQFTSSVQNDVPFIWMHARSHFLHSLIPSSIMAWLKC